ncbi:ribonucleotide-diphosphate reductase subunit beta [Candidatus Parabeggiatoa sp. HSG14]|uniref:ribonucleotide-diphosphate reductase subunit beta n=1 Tax=Candidatus Parabeggiatoa sp. HSG14 TaxID=3055593 RepID=UPI0025A822F4|nr:ribonucleotide-diphosphate reductase subunit beta [Thiotrichales bacterium HSG14]
MLDFDEPVVTLNDDFSTVSSNTDDTQWMKSKPIRRKTVRKTKTISPIASSLDPITIGSKRPNSDDIKIIGGRGYDLRQPIPVKYTTVRERFLNARKNFWTPNDIPMGEDKLQWNTGHLTEAEMWLFKTNISYLTAGDNLVPDNLVNAILGHITANEMRQYLRWVMAEEANHIESYLFVLESFGLDEQGQGQVFTLYEEIPELVEKVNWNLTFTNNVANSGAPIGSYEANQALLKDILSYYIFEYLFFPLGFSQIFALARKGKLRNTAQQYSYIWRDENLHSSNGLWLIRQIIKENPRLWDNTMQENARALINEAVELETLHAHVVMPDGGILGMPVNTYINFARFVADNICKNLGLKPLFGIREHPMPWISEYELNHEVNFFEGRVREYQTGSQLTWD